MLAVASGIWFSVAHTRIPTQKPKSSSTITRDSGTVSSHVKQVSGFNKQQYSLTDPASIWIIVNKQHPLRPSNYIPADLTTPNVPLASPGADNMKMRTVTATALMQMFAAAKQSNLNLRVDSAYRSYAYQQTLYTRYVQTSGQAVADQESARAGYSEHQTGLAVDIGATSGTCSLEQCFSTTPEGGWLAANAHQYGFILRYPADKTTITGYEYEPWHFRYVGVVLSQEMYSEHIATLEEFFNITGGATYTSTP
jgi:zinc D-Ala-D-Ala carboxypeptidase